MARPKLTGDSGQRARDWSDKALHLWSLSRALPSTDLQLPISTCNRYCRLFDTQPALASVATPAPDGDAFALTVWVCDKWRPACRRKLPETFWFGM